MKKRISETIIRTLTAIMAAAVFFAAAFSLPVKADEGSGATEETVIEGSLSVETEEETDDLTDPETEEETETETEEETAGEVDDTPIFTPYMEFPLAEITDRWQLSEENGDDPGRSDESMRLMDDTYTYDAAFEAHISAFPDSYKNALRRIHAMYPNFTFVADNIGMTLDEAVRTQIAKGYKTYRGTFTNDYDTIYTFMNPLTYLYPEYDPRYDVYSSSFDIDWHSDADFFMFADHAYSTNQYGDALQFLVDGCDFLEDEDMDSIIAASAACQMNPYVMASTVILEKGWHAKANGNGDVTGRVVNKGHVDAANVYSQAGGSTVLASLNNTDVFIVANGNYTASDGKTWLKIIYDYDGDLFDSKVHGVPGYVEESNVSGISYFNTYYNLFSVNQSDDNPVVGGIAYAMSHGWTSIALSFEGGARFCKDFYYDANQTTYYYMHYNVLDVPSRWWHEYSTGVSAGLKCARILRYAYDYDHSQSLLMRIPVYDPEPCVKLYNGIWTYFNSRGVPDYTYNGVAFNENGTWFIRDGVVDFSVNGLAEANGTWYYFSGGKLNTDYTGIAQGNGGWWRVVKGQVDPYADGVYENENGWWYVKDGKVQFDYTGIKPNSNGWWRIVDGKVDFSCTSVEENENGWWYLKDGKVQFGYTGIKPNKYGWWRIVNGEVDFDAEGVYQNENGWWYCKGGKVDFSYNGIAKNENGWWRIKGGKVDFSCTTVEKIGNEWLYISGGKVQYGYTGIKSNSNGWWRIVKGRVDFEAEGVYQNENGWWYLKDGKVQFGYTGIKPNENGWWRIENGKVNFGFTGLASNENGWWYLSGGKVDFSYKGIVQNSNGYWYVEGGKVQFGYTGIAQGRYGRYYIQNGKINWNFTGTYTDPNGTGYNIVDGEVR
ncbi:MAG: hypothetical protein E7233_01025 [Lachnospiraceae bacterium]|nr:hypothetical protein [Lachnospiraceae bacterium]